MIHRGRGSDKLEQWRKTKLTEIKFTKTRYGYIERKKLFYAFKEIFLSSNY